MDHNQLGNLVLSIGIIIFAAHLFTAMFKKTKIPDVLLLILIGILIGPKFLEILKPQDFGFAGPILSSIALILMLFEGGNHLSLSNLTHHQLEFQNYFQNLDSHNLVLEDKKFLKYVEDVEHKSLLTDLALILTN